MAEAVPDADTFDYVIVGAGSAITQDVPADALGVARGKQEVRTGWAARFRSLQAARKKTARPAHKAPARKTAAKKAPAKKTAAKKAPAKKAAPAKKTTSAAKKTAPAKKTTAVRKTALAKAASAKKTPARSTRKASGRTNG